MDESTQRLVEASRAAEKQLMEIFRPFIGIPIPVHCHTSWSLFSHLLQAAHTASLLLKSDVQDYAEPMPHGARQHIEALLEALDLDDKPLIERQRVHVAGLMRNWPNIT